MTTLVSHKLMQRRRLSKRKRLWSVQPSCPESFPSLSRMMRISTLPSMLWDSNSWCVKLHFRGLAYNQYTHSLSTKRRQLVRTLRSYLISQAMKRWRSHQSLRDPLSTTLNLYSAWPNRESQGSQKLPRSTFKRGLSCQGREQLKIVRMSCLRMPLTSPILTLTNSFKSRRLTRMMPLTVRPIMPYQKSIKSKRNYSRR